MCRGGAMIICRRTHSNFTTVKRNRKGEFSVDVWKQVVMWQIWFLEEACFRHFSHKETLCDFLQANFYFTRKTAVLRFWAPFWGTYLGAAYDDQLRLVGKRVVDFLLLLIQLFARCYHWGATSDYRLKIGDFAPTRPVSPKISGRKGHPHQSFFFSEN